MGADQTTPVPSREFVPMGPDVKKIKCACVILEADQNIPVFKHYCVKLLDCLKRAVPDSYFHLKIVHVII